MNGLLRSTLICSAVILAAANASARADEGARRDADVLIVGAGLAGLSAAIDAAAAGADVLVVDMNSVFGGHGIQSGGVAVIGSPMQAVMGFEDSPERAYRDWMEWTVDGHPGWTRFYTENSREMIYDWVTGFGARFDRVIPSHGNSVPRFHMTYRRGLNLVRPLFLEALRYSNIRFRYNLVARHLVRDNGRVTGVEATDLRLGVQTVLKAHSVLLATGGFESNIDMVRRNWRSDLPVPEGIFSMSGQNSRGSGHVMAMEVGAALVHLDRQYNGYSALPNVLGLDSERGFVGGIGKAIWVNSKGERFVTEQGIDRYVFPVVMRQEPPGYWSVFDSDDRHGFRINSPHFVSAEAVDAEKIQRLVVENPEVTLKADNLAELARLAGLPEGALVATVERFNAQVRAGESREINGLAAESAPPDFTIDTPPYYATRVYPMANKSAGGISIDMGTRVLDADGNAIAGLYAAGEVTGSAGINGLNGLDGMFTGPAILTGRVAGRTMVSDLGEQSEWEPLAFKRFAGEFPQSHDPEAAPLAAPAADSLRPLLAQSRDGYWHFERVHALVVERDYPCNQCHSQALPYASVETRMQRAAQAVTCGACHLAPAGTLDPTSGQAKSGTAD